MIARAKGEQPIHYAYGGPVEGDRELDQSGFYNAAAEAAKGIPQAKGTPQQMMSMVQKVPGTQESIKWSGADHAFAGQPIVSKGDLVKHFQTNAPKLEETQLGGRQSNMETKYHKYTIPGGENYREVLLQAPLNKSPERDRMSAIDERRHAIEKELMKLNDEELDKHISTQGIANVDDIMMQKMHLLSEQENLRSEYKDLVPKTWNLDYKSPHWYNKPNLVAHLRMSDRTLPQTGEKALHLEELQSDWGQAGRAGFKKSPEELASMKADMLAAHKNFLNLIGPVSGATEDQIQAAEDKSKAVMNKWNEASKATTPEGPYVGSTAKWTELGLKRALIEAARNGHDKLVWTPGQDQADRYDLSQQVKQILVENHGGKFHVKAYDHDGSKVINEHVDTPEEIARLIGKEAADKAMEHMESSRNAGSHIPRADLRGVDLKVGGEGMKGYYDKIVPTALARIVKSIGHTPEFGTDYIQGRKDDRDLVLINRRGQYHVETPDMHNNEGNWQDGEHVAGPFATREEADAHRTNLYKGLKAVPSLKITPAMRETISKGLPRKTGGFVPPARSSAVEQALKLTSKSGATLPAAVFLARQHQRRN
jgi:hypothetical protein